MRRPETRNRPGVLANILSKFQNFHFCGIKSEIYQTSLEHIFQKILFSSCRAFKTTLQPRRRRTALSVSCPCLVFVRIFRKIVTGLSLSLSADACNNLVSLPPCGGRTVNFQPQNLCRKNLYCHGFRTQRKIQQSKIHTKDGLYNPKQV